MGNYFIPRKTIQVYTKLRHINLTMRRVRYSIYAKQRTRNTMHRLGNSLDIMNRAQDIRSVCTRDQYRLR